MTLQATTTNVIYEWAEPEKLNKNGIQLSKQLTQETRWAKVHTAGKESMLQVGDDILLSARPVSYHFEFDNKELHNTADASVMAFKREGKLGATCGTIIYEWITEKEKVSEGGIILIQKDANKELEPRWALVVACGPTSGVSVGDNVLLAFKSDAYTIKIDGRTLHNAGKEEVIAFTSFSSQ